MALPSRLLVSLGLLTSIARSHAVVPRPLRLLPDDLTEVFLIGDLHADADCARSWVARTGAVDLEATPWAWTGGNGTALVFMGDYVDKGLQGRGVLELVKALTDAFPDRVAAVIGNHDFFALLDATLALGTSRPMGVPVSTFTYAFNHPQVRGYRWESLSLASTAPSAPAGCPLTQCPPRAAVLLHRSSSRAAGPRGGLTTRNYLRPSPRRSCG